MKKIPVIVLSILVLGVSLGFSVNANADSRNCKSEMICVKTGDYLKYEIKDGFEQYIEFGKSLDGNRIEYVERGTYDDGSPYEDHYILDKETGETFELDNPNEKYSSFDDMARVPVTIDNSDPFNPVSCIDTQYDYNGKNRDVYSCKFVEDESYIEMVLDKETGIRLYMVSDFRGEVDGEKFAIQGSGKLIDTNIISSEMNPQKETPSSKVPDWIKNNAKWWADGQIDDQTFVNGVQFLIKENIIHVAKSTEKLYTQEQNIPDWIKNNAKWWAQGLITEDDFLKGIQFLASNGIIKVN